MYACIYEHSCACAFYVVCTYVGMYASCVCYLRACVCVSVRVRARIIQWSRQGVESLYRRQAIVLQAKYTCTHIHSAYRVFAPLSSFTFASKVKLRQCTHMHVVHVCVPVSYRGADTQGRVFCTSATSRSDRAWTHVYICVCMCVCICMHIHHTCGFVCGSLHTRQLYPSSCKYLFKFPSKCSLGTTGNVL